jgi:hypothetical protein
MHCKDGGSSDFVQRVIWKRETFDMLKATCNPCFAECESGSGDKNILAANFVSRNIEAKNVF